MCSTYLLAHSLHFLQKYVDFSWETICQHKLVGFVVQRGFKCLWFFPSQNSKPVYGFGPLSLKPMQGNEVVYLTMLVHVIRSIKTTCGAQQ